MKVKEFKNNPKECKIMITTEEIEGNELLNLILTIADRASLEYEKSPDKKEAVAIITFESVTEFRTACAKLKEIF